MSGARAAEVSEALGLTSMMAWLGRGPRWAAGGRGMCRDVCSFRIVSLAEMEAAWGTFHSLGCNLSAGFVGVAS